MHDNSQIEIKTLHHLPSPELFGVSQSFCQELYLFIPKSMGVNAESFPKESFYRSLTNYIRLKTPAFLDESERKNRRIDRIMPKLNHYFLLKETPQSMATCLNEVRIFGAYINDQLKSLQHKQELTWREPLLEIGNIILAFREIMDAFESMPKERRIGPLIEAFRYVDEFISNRIEETIVKISPIDVRIAGFLEREFLRRQTKRYLCINTAKAKETDYEAFLFRMGRFKKYISEVLYLEVKRFKKDRVVVNLAAIVGAAVAAMINSLADPNQRTSLSAGWFLSLRSSLPLMIAIVTLVYVTKDRVKDHLKEHLVHWFKPWLPDYNFEIRTRSGSLIGRCKEDVQYLQSKMVPNDISVLRDYQRDLPLPSESQQEVLFYRRSFEIRRKAAQQLFHGSQSIKDILRFDLQPFMAKLGDPLHIEKFVDINFRVNEVALPKVYHINLVLKYTVCRDAGREEQCHFQRVRLIVHKGGIKRIEYPPIETLLAEVSVPNPAKAA